MSFTFSCLRLYTSVDISNFQLISVISSMRIIYIVYTYVINDENQGPDALDYNAP